MFEETLFCLKDWTGPGSSTWCQWILSSSGHDSIAPGRNCWRSTFYSRRLILTTLFIGETVLYYESPYLLTLLCEGWHFKVECKILQHWEPVTIWTFHIRMAGKLITEFSADDAKSILFHHPANGLSIYRRPNDGGDDYAFTLATAVFEISAEEVSWQILLNKNNLPALANSVRPSC